jgi:hypothetical protein
MQVNIITHPVEILTGHYQISGNLELRGSPAVFINDATFNVFNIHEATITPLASGSAVGAVKVPLLYVPKHEPHVMLIGNFESKDAQLLPNKIRMVCFTDTYVIRAAFHVGPETKAVDTLYFQAGPFFPTTDSEIFPLRELSADLGGQADLLYIHKDNVRSFYSE